jgi:uncharacterized damage-inducible protein DinB
MPVNELLLAEFDQEMSNTRKTLERVPAEKWDWKPHPKSGSLGWMASHVATLPNFTVGVIQTSDFEIDGHPSPKVKDASELLKVFAEQRQKARDAIANLTDEQLHQTWTLKYKGQVLMSLPRYNALRIMCFNHLVHHRGQLTMYLRALDVPVPPLYGPSADERGF